MLTADEFRSELSNAYYELETALAFIRSDHDELFDETGDDLLPGAIDALLLFLPDAARDIRAASESFNEKLAVLQRRTFHVLPGGRQ
jgi:hypothetical protein